MTLGEIFRWVVVAKRPLTLHELREALAIEKYRSSLKAERLINNIVHLVSWCEGYLAVDEVSDEISFAHPTMKHFVIQHHAALHQDSFRLTDMKKEAGEICVTYLNFSDSETQLVRHDATQQLTGEHLLTASLRATGMDRTMVKPLKRLMRSQPSDIDVGSLLHARFVQQATRVDLQRDHPFLAYASEHWLPHSSDFEQSDRIWPLWYRLLSDQENRTALRPWTAEGWTNRDDTLLSCILHYDHVALMQAIQESDNRLSGKEWEYIRAQIIDLGKLALWWARIENFQDTATLTEKLYIAAQKGLTKIVAALLKSGADVNASGGVYGHALQAAAYQGNEDVVRLLLDAGADVNASGGFHSNPLQAAAFEGDKDITRLLLDAGADVNASGGTHSNAI